MTWAIGDVHGCFDQMKEVLGHIPEDEQVVFLGDYIDRGPKIAEVVSFVSENFRNERYVFIRGNHEQMMIDAVFATMHKDDIFDGWMINGGRETVSQLGIGACEEVASLFKSLPTRYETFTNYFVHGGMSPGVPFSKQRDEVIMWLRPSEYDYNHGKYLVHGHTPVRKPDIRHHSANIDTGCVYGNGRKLTAVKLGENGKVIDMVQA